MAASKQTLSQEELSGLTRELPDWKIQDGELVREWTFKDFVAAMAFVNRVAEPPNRLGITRTSTSAITG